MSDESGEDGVAVGRAVPLLVRRLASWTTRVFVNQPRVPDAAVLPSKLWLVCGNCSREVAEFVQRRSDTPVGAFIRRRGSWWHLPDPDVARLGFVTPEGVSITAVVRCVRCMEEDLADGEAGGQPCLVRAEVFRGDSE